MSAMSRKSDLPKELQDKLSAFDKSLTNLENKLEPLLNVPQVELNAQLKPLDKAKLDLVAAYSINSLFWMYLNVCGVNPKEHGIKQELDRIRSYMNRVKEVQDRENAPKLNVPASKRVVRNALWQAAQSKIQPMDKEQPTMQSAVQPTIQEAGDKTEEAGPSDKQQEGKGKKRKSGDKKDKKSKKRKAGKSHGNRYMDTSIE